MIATVIAAALLLLPATAFAWGAGVHVMHGSLILENLRWLPNLGQILAACPQDFLYGCVSADIFIGKGSKAHDEHCHNWSVGKRLLSGARTRSETAFAYGYLSHLAADIISHNIYVPNQLYTTSSPRRVGHIYWEMRAELFTDEKYWRLAKELLTDANGRHDEFLQEIIRRRGLSFETKKRLFRRAIKLYLERRDLALRAMEKNFRSPLTADQIGRFHQHCVNLIVDFLENPDDAICLQYDPIGADRLEAAKRLRRISRWMNGSKPTEPIFEIPREILALKEYPVR